MRRLMLLAGAAALAAGAPAIAQGQGKGKGNGGGGGPPAAATHHPGPGKGHGGGGAGRGHQEQRMTTGRADRNERKAERSARNQQARGAERAAKEERKATQRFANEERKAVQRAAKQDRKAGERMARNERPHRERQDRAGRNVWTEAEPMRRDSRVAQRRQVDAVRDDRRWAAEDHYRDGGFRRVVAYRDGCPPGLAKKNAFCMPPGQLRKAHLIGQAAPATFAGYEIPERYRYRFADADGYDYRWDDEGYIYRVDQRTNIIQSVIPVLASGLLVGEPMPLGFDTYNVPFQYRDRFADTDEWMYRYDDQAIYRVNPRNRLVEGIVQLLAGGSGFNIGQMLPSGYDAYNLPLQYRDQYQDSPDHMYRYADGNIYDVDPTSGIIQQVISAIL